VVTGVALVPQVLIVWGEDSGFDQMMMVMMMKMMMMGMTMLTTT
jgi:hypothetical protein